MVNNLSVLMTDERDEASIKLANVLRNNKMDVRCCGKNGAELLKLYEDYHPDVIIMDAFLQHIDAMGVISRINMRDPVTRPMIIVMSSIDNPNFERDLTKAGVDYYFLKPIDPQMMAERIVQISSWKGISVSPAYELQQDLNVVITDILHQIGVPAHIKGYKYVREAIRLAVEDPEMLNSVTKILYPTVAKCFGSTASRVERAIRHGIEVAWDRGDVEVLNAYFGYTIQSQRDKPTNSEFVAMISDKIRLQRRISI
ncbi:MAG: sporulation transcription factor Spo0A [Clostridia bacterium]|nr:sporulation transcription factor Spo0A [Clostridia bacterium]